MHRALRPYGDVRALEHLYACGAPVDAVDEQGRTCLYVAAKAGYEDAVRWLLANGADARCTAEDGRSPLHAAASAGHVGTCKLLLASLPDADAIRAMQATDAKGQNPSEVAAAGNHMYVVRCLLDTYSRCVASKKARGGGAGRDQASARPPAEPMPHVGAPAAASHRTEVVGADKPQRLRGYAVPEMDSPPQSGTLGAEHRVKTP